MRDRTDLTLERLEGSAIAVCLACKRQPFLAVPPDTWWPDLGCTHRPGRAAPIRSRPGGAMNAAELADRLPGFKSGA